MNFDLASLKATVAEKWREFARDTIEAGKNLGVSSAYGLLIAGAFLPLAQAYASDSITATVALATIASNVGVNLLSNFVQRTFDKQLSPAQVEQLARDDPSIQQVLDALISNTDSIQAAQDALGQNWTAFSNQLQNELSDLGHSSTSLAIIGGQTIRSAGVAAPVNITVQNGGQVIIYGSLLQIPVAHQNPTIDE